MSLLIVFNNYFHDLATGVFVACAVVMWAIARWGRDHMGEASGLAEVYRALTTALWVSFAWIIIGGIPRTVFFPTYEFIPALGKQIVSALVVKHIFMFLSVGVGIAAWLRARRIVRGDATDMREPVLQEGRDR